MPSKDEFGDRLKKYEAVTTGRRAVRGKPLIARLDGRSFSNFTRSMKRPYDEQLSSLMVATMRHLVTSFHADVGYCQSDEITLGWYHPSDSNAEYPFGGRFQKLESLLAAECSVYFNAHLFCDAGKKYPVFDCRAFEVPTLQEAYHCFLWRQQDCTKNAISMLAQKYFSHKQLHKKSGNEKLQMLEYAHCVNFGDFPDFFKFGTFARRVNVVKCLAPEELANIAPEFHPSGPIARKEMQTSNTVLTSLTGDPIDFLFAKSSV